MQEKKDTEIKCSYCDFHFSTNLKTKGLLIDSIVLELKSRFNYLKNNNLESIYFGGGTPSLLNESDFNAIFEALKMNYSIDKSAEVTLEANPDDISAENLKLWKKLGFNRLSIGLQSFNNEELKWMNRAHSSEQSIKSVLLEL